MPTLLAGTRVLDDSLPACSYPTSQSQQRQAEPQKDQDKANQKGLWLCSSGYFDLEAKSDCNERTHLILNLLRNTCLIECMTYTKSVPSIHPAVFYRLWLLYVLESGKAAWTIAFRQSERTKISGLCLFYFKLPIIWKQFYHICGCNA